ELRDSAIKVCAVVGFPLGKMSSAAKLDETALALKDGAREIDMVINLGALKSGDDRYVYNEIRALAEICHDNGALLKVIHETCNLTEQEKIFACELSVEADADFVKTSTGFGSGGATLEDVALMRKVVGPDIGVKASGGVKEIIQARAFRAAGA